MKGLRRLLTPISWLYGASIKLHQCLYTWNILKSKQYNQAIINVGNLSLGGTGKSPMVVYLYQQLHQINKTAVISRGYGRSSKGLLQVSQDSTVEAVGDEALQFKKKFPNSLFFVSEKRSLAIEAALNQSCTLVILDDALQHHALKTHYNILLTAYEVPFFKDSLLPVGRLRDHKSNYKKAQLIVVTNCPQTLSLEQKKAFEEQLNLGVGQQLFFSSIQYRPLYPLFGTESARNLQSFRDQAILLLSGIAQPDSLSKYLKSQVEDCTLLTFNDHQHYRRKELGQILEAAEGKTIITTEKDAVKLALFPAQFTAKNIAVWVLPINVKFLFEQETDFIDNIKNYIKKNRPN